MYIGEWALMLTANAQGMYDVMNTAAARVTSFATRARVAMLTAGAGIGNALSSITGLNLGGPLSQISSLGSAVMGIGGGAMTGGIIGAAVAVTVLGGAMLKMAHSTIEEVAAQDKFAKRVGMTAQEVAGLQAIAERQRVPWEQMDDIVGKWGVRLGALRREMATPGGGPMVAALASLGIHAESFANANLGEQFRMISEGIAGIENPMQRLAVLGQIFGNRMAPEMARLLAAPSADFGNLAGIGAASGHNFTAEQAAAMADLSKQMKQTKIELGIVFGELADDLAVVATPAIRSVVVAIRSLATEGRPVIGFLAGVIAVLAGPFLAPIAAIGLLITGLSYGVRFLVDAIQSGVTKIMPFVSAIGDAISPLVSTMTETFGQFFGFLAGKFTWVGDLIGMWWDGVKYIFLAVVAVIGGAVVLALLAITGGIALVSTMISALLRGLQRVASAIATMTGSQADRDVANGLERGAQAMANIASSANQAGQGIVNAVANMANLLNQGTGAATARSEWDQLREDLHWVYGYAGDELAQQYQRLAQQHHLTINDMMMLQALADDAGMSLADAMPHFGATSNVGWSGIADRLESENRLANLTREQRELEQLRADATYQSANATIRLAMEQRLQAAQNERFQSEEIARLAQLREATIQQTRTPLEAFQQRMNELNELFPSGGETYDRAIGQAFRDLERASGQHQDKAPQAVLAGSAAEQVAINAALRQDRKESEQERTRRVLEQSQEIQRQQLEENRNIRRALEELNFQVI